MVAKIGIIFILIILSSLITPQPELRASSPSLGTATTFVTGTLSATDKDTLSQYITLGGDSVGIMLSFNKDSVSGTVYYMYVTPDNNSDKTLTDATTLGTFDCNDGQQAAFLPAIPRLAGTYRAQIIYILTNDDISSSPRTVTMKSYIITWR